LEVNALHAEVARDNIARAALEEVVDIRLGPAAELLAQLAAVNEEPFDLIFIDVDETQNTDLFPAARGLARQGSVIIIGAADLVRGCRRLYATLARDPAVSAVAVQAVGSAGRHGFVMAVVSDSL
jgi:predicted O-methyltransferase YrrM